MNHYISSDNATTDANAHSGEFRIMMNIPSSHDRVALLFCSLPKTYHLIPHHNRSVRFDSTVYSIPAGCYSIASLVNALNTACAGAPDSGSPIVPAPTWAFSNITSRLTVTTNAANMTLTRHIAGVLGYTYPTNAIYGGSLTAPYSVNLTFTNIIYITASIARSFASNPIQNIIDIVTLNNQNDYSFSNWRNPSPRDGGAVLTTYNPFVPEQLQAVEVHFKLLDVEGKIMQFNGVPVEMIIYTFKSDDLYGLMSKYVKAHLSILQEQRVVQKNTTEQNMDDEKI